MNDGIAAKFLDDAVIGYAIQLIEGEKLAALKELAERRIPNGAFLKDVSKDRGKIVVKTWNQHFLDD